ncbi:MarR family winged helix-turn-helix transcriptional regulator [Kitasatospora mediocidica]|uniref:MarR family winged helix-turn-helix transcriptional regulator n=1 Tax=Kitasatospora mediocidica TaxID=58352 RepID=UPI00068FD353|nr:MarR family transcriptional regulator [Kitasatospora mediocidica]
MDIVSPLSGRTDAAAASSVVELLEVLWGGGRDLSSVPVSVSQLQVLYVLEKNEGINLRTLTETLDSRPSSVSRLCDRLEAVGFLRRSASPSSRRELELHLTTQSRTFLAELRARREAGLAQVLDAMRPADRKALVTGLRAFGAAADQRVADGDGGASAVPHIA